MPVEGYHTELIEADYYVTSSRGELTFRVNGDDAASFGIGKWVYVKELRDVKPQAG